MAEDPVSFTDTNAETMGGGKAGTSSAMLDLIGDLKKKQKDGEKVEAEDSSSKDKKKKKKKKKGKMKKKRGTDRYESQNYLMRIEGSICCAALIMVLILIVFNIACVVVGLIITGGDMRDIFNKSKVE